MKCVQVQYNSFYIREILSTLFWDIGTTKIEGHTSLGIHIKQLLPEVHEYCSDIKIWEIS